MSFTSNLNNNIYIFKFMKQNEIINRVFTKHLGTRLTELQAYIAASQKLIAIWNSDPSWTQLKSYRTVENENLQVQKYQIDYDICQKDMKFLQTQIDDKKTLLQNILNPATPATPGTASPVASAQPTGINEIHEIDNIIHSNRYTVFDYGNIKNELTVANIQANYVEHMKDSTDNNKTQIHMETYATTLIMSMYAI
jgi:hypothetical protein